MALVTVTAYIKEKRHQIIKRCILIYWISGIIGKMIIIQSTLIEVIKFKLLLNFNFS